MGDLTVNQLNNMSTRELLWLGLSALILLRVIGGFIWRVIYDLYFHPLRKFPGPWLAAWSNASKDQKLFAQGPKTDFSSRLVFPTGS